MKFKAKVPRNNVMELHSTRNVTLFESPEFGHMVVDGKVADNNAVDSGRLRVELAIEQYPGYPPSPMSYLPADFKVSPAYFVTKAEFSVHGLVIGEYAAHFDHQVNHVVYTVTVPEKYKHDSEILMRQLYLLTAGLSQ